jgi:hypothetical protein
MICKYIKRGWNHKKNKSILTIILNKKNKRKKNGTKSKKNSTENKIKKQIQFYKLILDIIIHLKGKTNKYYIIFFYKEKKNNGFIDRLMTYLMDNLHHPHSHKFRKMSSWVLHLSNH